MARAIGAGSVAVGAFSRRPNGLAGGTGLPTPGMRLAESGMLAENGPPAAGRCRGPKPGGCVLMETACALPELASLDGAA
jgi:hypothetical protein